MSYLVWIEVRKLKTHPALLVLGWTGFQITIRNLVILASLISYLDTIDFPATDHKTAFEVFVEGGQAETEGSCVCLRSSLLC